MTPSSIVSFHVAHPELAAPIRACAGTRTPISVTSNWVSEASVICCCIVTPGVAVTGAGQHEEVGRGLGEGNVQLHPVEDDISAVGAGARLYAARSESVPGLQPRSRDDRITRHDAREQ